VLQIQMDGYEPAAQILDLGLTLVT